MDTALLHAQFFCVVEGLSVSAILNCNPLRRKCTSLTHVRFFSALEDLSVSLVSTCNQLRRMSTLSLHEHLL